MDVRLCILLLVCLGWANIVESTYPATRRTRSRHYSGGCSIGGPSGCQGNSNGGYSSGYSSGSSYASQSSYSSSQQQQQQAGQLEIGQQLLDSDYDDLTETELIDTGLEGANQQTVDQEQSTEGSQSRTRWRTIPAKGQGHESSWSSHTSWSSQSQSSSGALPAVPGESEIESLLQGIPEGVNITRKGSLGPGHTYYYQRRVYNWTSGARPVGCGVGSARTCNVTVIRTTGGQKAGTSRGTQYVQQQGSRNKGATLCGSTTSNCVITSSVASDRGDSEELVQQETEQRYLPATRPPHFEKGPPATRSPPPPPLITELPEYRPAPARPVYVEKGPPSIRYSPPTQQVLPEVPEVRPPPATRAPPSYNYNQQTVHQQQQQQQQQQRQTTYQQQSRPIGHIPAPRPTRPDYSRAEIHCINGIIRGQLITTITGREVYAFLGIPFAKPPVGNLRFRKPEPVDNWEEPIDATRKPPACYQVNASSFPNNPGEAQWNAASISEDCLYLNIWIPATTFRAREQRLTDVLFWIYGGGLFSGSSSLDIYDGAILASENDIIVVSSQYRLGPLGFLFLDDAEAPGNVGLLDQVAALRWVNSNIRYFGGNPDSVTLMGESCGAVSVNLHLISPASRGLFNRGILMSGVASAPYATVTPTEAQRLALDIARHVGCDVTRSKQEVISCLRQTDAGVLTAAQFQFFTSILKFPFVATIDREFLPACPTRLSETTTKRAEVIVGSTKDEGSFFLVYQYLRQLGEQRSPQVSREQFVDMISESHRGITTYAQTEAISTYYTNWKNPDDSRINVQRLVDSISDGFFTCQHRQFADQWSEKGNAVYQYYFTHRTSTNPWPEWTGVLHADDIDYAFGVPLKEPERFTEEERQLSVHIMRLFTDFAKTGVPSRNWHRYTERRPTFVELNAGRITDETSAELGPRANECAFWSKILPTVSVTPGCQGEDESQHLLERYLSSACTNYANNGQILLGSTKSQCRAARYGLSGAC